MKRAWQLLTLAAVLSATSWLGSPSAAHAIPPCSNYQGKACTPPGTVMCNDPLYTEVCDCVQFQGKYIWLCTT